MREEIDIFDANQSEREAPTIRCHHRVVPNSEASFAMDLIKIGMCLSEQVPNEGDEGHHDVLLAPADIVDRACRITEQMVLAFEQRGWLISVPSREEMIERLRRTGGRMAPGFRQSPGFETGPQHGGGSPSQVRY